MLDLKKFCHRDPARSSMNDPFTQDGMTWATNGFIAIGVPVRPDVPANIYAPDMKKAKPTVNPSEWSKVPMVSVEPCKFCKGEITEFQCPECKGSGTVAFVNNYSEYTLDCNTCDGDGTVDECQHCFGTGCDSDKQTDIGPATFNDRVLMLIMDLPGVEISPTGPEAPAYVRFDGGIGYLMPARKIIEGNSQ